MTVLRVFGVRGIGFKASGVWGLVSDFGFRVVFAVGSQLGRQPGEALLRAAVASDTED